MPRICTICGAHPNRAEIETALLRGAPMRDIARRFGTSKDAVARHRGHMAPTLVAPIDERARTLSAAETTQTAAARSSPARARELRDARVDFVVGLMTRGRWQGGRSHRELSKRWECSVGAVADYAREANGVIRRAVSGELEVIRTEVLTGIHRIRDVAMKLTKPMLVAKDVYEHVSTPDCSAALRAYELQAKMLGLFAEAAPALTAVVEPTSPEEQLAELAKLKIEIEEEERRVAQDALAH